MVTVTEVSLYEDLAEWERIYDAHCSVVKAVVSRVRNLDWREDAEQIAWEGILKTLRKQNWINLPLVIRISVNAANTVFRSHLRDPVSVETLHSAWESSVSAEGSFRVELDEWVYKQKPNYKRVLTHVLSGARYRNLRDLGVQLNLSKATCARALVALREYLKIS